MDLVRIEALLKALLNHRENSPELVEELKEYTSDLKDGSLAPSDARYIEALAKRLNISPEGDGNSLPASDEAIMAKTESEVLSPKPTKNETPETLQGRKSEPINSSFFYLSGLGFLVLGVILISNKIWIFVGLAMVLTVFPCLMLYPLIRFLFGGKDSLGAVVTTVIVEEVLKNQISKIGKKGNRKY